VASSSTSDSDLLDKDADIPAFTRDEIRKYDGKNGSKIYIACAAKVFDCTEGAAIYGPGGEYEAYAGRDISRAAAKFSVDAKYLDACEMLQDLNQVEKDKLRHMYNTLYSKYPIIGKVVKVAKEDKKTQ
jgi:membrane-associated progesterone receptor component